MNVSSNGVYGVTYVAFALVLLNLTVPLPVEAVTLILCPALISGRITVASDVYVPANITGS